MAMNKARRTANLNNILTYDTLGNSTLIANLTVEGLTGAGFVKADANGLLSVDTAAYTVVTGATNYLTKITAPNTLGQSLVYDNGTSVYVNSTTGVVGYNHSFTVVANTAGGMVVSTTNTASAIGIVNSASGNKTWDISPFNNTLVINESGVNTSMVFHPGGNITVGDITTTGHKFEVVGSFRTTGNNTLSQLSGVGTRMVVVDTNGLLSTQAIATGSVTGTGVAGQVAFWTGTSVQSGSNNLFWDNTNARLGIGTNAPSEPLTIQFNNSSPSILGSYIKNTNTAGRTGAGYYNDSNEGGGFGTYGSAFGIPTYRNNFGVIATKSLVFFADGNIATGGSSTISFITGGYSVAAAMTLTGAGRLLLNSTTDTGERLQVTGTSKLAGNTTVTGGNLSVFNSSAPLINFQDQTGLNNSYQNASFGIFASSSLSFLISVWGKTAISVSSHNFNNTGLATTTINSTPINGFSSENGGHSLVIPFSSTTQRALTFRRTDNTLNTGGYDAIRLSSATYGTYTFFRVDDIGNIYTRGNAVFGSETAGTSVVDIIGSTNTRASLRIRSGDAPTTPNEGDIWATTTDLVARVNGTNYSLINSGLTGSGAAGQVTFWNAASGITGSNSFLWDNATTQLTLGTTTVNPIINLAASANASTTNVVINNAAFGGTLLTFRNPADTRYLRISGINFDIVNTGNISAGQSLIAGSINITGTTVSGFNNSSLNLNGDTVTLSSRDNTAATIILLAGNGEISFRQRPASVTTTRAIFAQSTGNFIIQNGGTFTDSGERLQVTGTAKITGATTITSQITAGNAQATAGSVVLRTTYSSGNISTIGTNGSSGGVTISYGAYPASTSTADAFLSGIGFASFPRSAYAVESDHRWLSAASALVAEGSAVTLTEKMRLYNSGNLVIQDGGTYTDSGEKLKVGGSARVNGNLVVSNVGNTFISISTGGSFSHDAVGTSGQILFTSTNGFRTKLPDTSKGFIIGATSSTQTTSSTVLIPSVMANNADVFQLSVTPNYTGGANTATILLNGTVSLDAINNLTGGIHTGIKIAETFAPNTANKNISYVGLSVLSTINQSLSAQITRGLYINPTLTAAADWRSIEWSNNSGYGLYGAGTAQNLLNGKLTVNHTVLSANFTNANTMGVFGQQLLNIPTGNQGTSGAVYAASSGFHYFRFNGNTTLVGDALWAASIAVSNIQFDTTGTVTMADGVGGGTRQRALSGMQIQMQTAGNNNGTVTKAAGLLIQGCYPSTGTGVTTFTEFAGIRINNLTEWGTDRITMTDRWGIFQAGADDKNHFNGLMVLGSTTSTGERMQVNGTMKVTGTVKLSGLPTSNTGLTAGDIWNNGGVLNIV